MQILIRAKGYNVQRAKVEANIVYDAKAYVGGGTVIAKALAEPTLWYDTSEIEQAIEEAWLLDLPLDLVLDSLHNNKQVAVLDKNVRKR